MCVVVSDGAGSSSHGGEGASLVCRMLSTAICDWTANHGGLPPDDQIHEWLDTVRDRLASVAEKRGLTKRQFASTLIALLVFGEELLALQIGDSALVARKAGCRFPLRSDPVFPSRIDPGDGMSRRAGFGSSW